MKPVSLQLYTIRTVLTESNHFDVLKQVASFGYSGVEAGVPSGMTAAEYRKRVQDLGLVVSSTWGSVDTEEAARASALNALELGTNLLVTGYGTEDYSSLEAVTARAAAVEKAAGWVAEEGVTLCVHNHWWEFQVLDGSLAYEEFADRCPSASLELDIYWTANFGAVDPAEEIARYRSRIPLLHVKDGPLVKGEPMVAVGSGAINMPAAIQSADPDVLRWLVVELDECATDMMEAVRESCDYLLSRELI